ncbi:MAG: MFS transporter [[Candidatus Thermochlorobacteriaceae] bacterium GBChlB]|nr:MAG: MFS transporter [[Candidatus Thermochlorobacteriaceae] bacterium GBChlB]
MKSSPLAILFFTVFLDLIGFGIVLPLLPNYARELGASPFLIGLCAAAYSVMQFFSSPIWGTFSDTVGRRPIILSSVATSVVSYLIFSQAHSIWLLLVSRVLAGIGSANVSVTQAYITDISTKDTRSKYLGILGAAFGLGFVLGPPLGGFIKTAYGTDVVGYTAAAFTFIDLLLAYFLLPESLKERKTDGASFKVFNAHGFLEALRRPAVNRLMVISFCFIFAFVNMQISVPLLWKEHYAMTDEHIGYLFSFIGIVSVIVQGGLIGRFSKQFGERALLLAGVVLMLAGILLLPYIPTSLMFSIGLIGLIFLAVGNGLVTPVNTALISLYTPPEEQGETLGIAQSIGSLARITGPFSGSLFYALDYHAPYWVGGAALVLGAVLAASLFDKSFAPAVSTTR